MKSNTKQSFSINKTIANKALLSLMLSSSAMLLLSGCGDNDAALNEIDISSEFSSTSEVDRLRYFREINADKARKDFKVTGAGVNVTIMGEIVDASHPDLKQRINKQYNTYAEKGVVHTGEGQQPYLFDLYGQDHGHGTHIAGTLAAECDGVGIQGVACGAKIDVYDLGAYENDRVTQKGWSNAHPFERFIESFNAALEDVIKKNASANKSRILTGSFNIESPAILYQKGGELEKQSITTIVKRIEENVESVGDISDKGLAIFQNTGDIEYLTRTMANNGGDTDIVMGSLLPLSSQWSKLEDAVQAYQKTDGVYIVTESNNIFENRTSVLNAMPSLSDKVDADLWISAVLAKPKGFDAAVSQPSVTEADITALLNGEYVTPINSCGQMASEYCILIPSYEVLSTMTRKLAESNLELLVLDGRDHQVFSGHSMGAPMIAGALALMEERNIKENKGYSMKDLVRILKENANRSFPGYDSTVHGKGLLDIEAALIAM